MICMTEIDIQGLVALFIIGLIVLVTGVVKLSREVRKLRKEKKRNARYYL